MKKLLSLPPNLVGCFHKLTGLSENEYFCSNDPIDRKLGSGGGSTWLLERCYDSWGGNQSFSSWIASENRILIHAGGQSRRLPSYAPIGKILTPIPVFRWERGQKLSQTLLDIQLPLYEQIMSRAPKNIHTMIVSGDVYIRGNVQSLTIPDADVVCFGLWLDSSIAKDHGVFFSERSTPNVLHSMLQKPSIEKLNEISAKGFYLTDIGVWLLSDRAVELLRKHSHQGDETINYDLYSEFGCSLGTNPTIIDEELNKLSVAIVPLKDGEFYHFGTSREMISSMLAIQNKVSNQHKIYHHSRKPHPSMFIQNSQNDITLSSKNRNLWIENSHIGQNWTLTCDNIVTGVPQNDWNVNLKQGQCLDIVPVGESAYVVRTYNIDDKFAGSEQSEKRFPVVDGDIYELGNVVKSMLENGSVSGKYHLISAEDITNSANLERVFAQKKAFRCKNWGMLAANNDHSVFYQVDLSDAAQEFSANKIPLPNELDAESSSMKRISDAMFRSEVERLDGKSGEQNENKAFSLLRDELLQSVLSQKQKPQLSVYEDQIVWGRSPVRIDISGGWTDTPPYCLMEGGSVINLAIEINGQPPLQVYIRSCKEYHIVLRSIDLGAIETVETFEQLADFIHVGSPFSIPKVALALAGFLPRYCSETYSTLSDQLKSFGSGIELTLLAAIPAGSGLGTSSILAATILGAINDFCDLAWDKSEICNRTLILEQLLTTGGGWQDQYGGVFGGVKLLETNRGFEQIPVVRWLPTDVFTQTEYSGCHLLYYTGITRTAKRILHEIVRRMFLNNNEQLYQLRNMKAHVNEMYEAIQRCDITAMGRLVRENWSQNQALDSGTNPENIRQITSLIDDLCLGYKIPGAGGGGYIYMVAKDLEAAARIKRILGENRPNSRARFVNMSLSKTGLQISRS